MSILIGLAHEPVFNAVMATQVVFRGVLLGAAVGKGSYLGKTGAAFQVVEIDMVAHVLLAGIDPGLVIPTGQLALAQRLGHQTAAALAGESGGVDGRDVPALARFGDETGKDAAMLAGLGQVLTFERVAVRSNSSSGSCSE